MQTFPERIVICALPAESDGIFEKANIPILFCGVGKVNAAILLCEEFCRYLYSGHPLPHVLNFGTAGSRSLPCGTVVSCDTFCQRDMDATALGFARGATPFDESPVLLQFDPYFQNLPQVTCGSGDSFVNDAPGFATAVYDMEAYALAKVCKRHGAAFASAKYISDGAGAGAAADWRRNVSKAARYFMRLYADPLDDLRDHMPTDAR